MNTSLTLQACISVSTDYLHFKTDKAVMLTRKGGGRDRARNEEKASQSSEISTTESTARVEEGGTDVATTSHSCNIRGGECGREFERKSKESRGYKNTS